MKKINLKIWVVLVGVFIQTASHAQTIISCTYDAAGNRIQRREITLRLPRTDITEQDTIDQGPEIYEDHLAGHDINIYPNPTKGELQVQITNLPEESPSSIEVYSLSGRLIYNKASLTESTRIDLSQVSNGAYVMRIIIGDKTTEWKIVKE